MKADGCEICATLFLTHGSCKCGESLVQVDNGWLSKAMFCPKCENVYVLKLTKVPNKQVSENFIAQCRKEVKNKGGKKKQRW